MAGARTILIVEDEPLISMMLEDYLMSLDHVIKATCETVSEALAMTEEGGFDLAILDVNLKGESVWPVAYALREKAIPFVLASGGFVEPPPPEFADAPMLSKPYTIDRLPAVSAAACGA